MSSCLYRIQLLVGQNWYACHKNHSVLIKLGRWPRWTELPNIVVPLANKSLTRLNLLAFQKYCSASVKLCCQPCVLQILFCLYQIDLPSGQNSPARQKYHPVSIELTSWPGGNKCVKYHFWLLQTDVWPDGPVLRPGHSYKNCPVCNRDETGKTLRSVIRINKNAGWPQLQIVPLTFEYAATERICRIQKVFSFVLSWSSRLSHESLHVHTKTRSLSTQRSCFAVFLSCTSRILKSLRPYGADGTPQTLQLSCMLNISPCPHQIYLMSSQNHPASLKYQPVKK